MYEFHEISTGFVSLIKAGGPCRTNKHSVLALPSEQNPTMMIKFTIVSDRDETTSILCDTAYICLRGKLTLSTGLMLSIFSPSPGPGRFLFVPFDENHGRKGELVEINKSITERNSSTVLQSLPPKKAKTPRAKPTKSGEVVHIPKFYLPLDVLADVWNTATIGEMSDPKYQKVFEHVGRIQKVIQDTLVLCKNDSVRSQAKLMAVVAAIVAHFNDTPIPVTFIKKELKCSFVSLSMCCATCHAPVY